jgi:TonB family protein
MSDFEGTALRRVTPEYPREAKSKGVSGTVQLRLLIGKSGYVKAACPVYPDGESKPDASLVAAAQKAALQWKFPRNFGLHGKLHLKFDYVELPIAFNFAPSRPPELSKQRGGAARRF